MKAKTQRNQVLLILSAFLLATAASVFSGCSSKSRETSVDGPVKPQPTSGLGSKDRHHSTEAALLTAAQTGNLPALLQLLEQGASPNVQYSIANSAQVSALMIATLYGHTEVANSLIAAGADTTPTLFGYSAKDFAIHLGNIEIVRTIETTN